MTRPVHAVAVIAYRQEMFIREAVRGDLAYTYGPFEITLLDDGCPEKVCQFISEELANYRASDRFVG